MAALFPRRRFSESDLERDLAAWPEWAEWAEWMEELELAGTPLGAVDEMVEPGVSVLVLEWGPTLRMDLGDCGLASELVPAAAAAGVPLGAIAEEAAGLWWRPRCECGCDRLLGVAPVEEACDLIWWAASLRLRWPVTGSKPKDLTLERAPKPRLILLALERTEEPPSSEALPDLVCMSATKSE